MTDHEIIDILKWTGHLHNPFGGGPQRVLPDVFDMSEDNPAPLAHPVVVSGLASYQDFMCQCLDPLCMKYHSRPLRDYGQIGPATRELMALPRCGCPDYGKDVQPATGSGSWKSCHGIGDFHAATVYVDESGMPSFLKPLWDEIWGRAAAAFADIGLRVTRTTDKAKANIFLSFVRRSNGWIGLAIVGQGQSCGSQIWCRFLSTYKPKNIVREWTTLIMHELGHNAGLIHSRGRGVMNPSIIHGLAASWKGDPSLPVLQRKYGGKPIPGGPDKREWWIGREWLSDRGQTLWKPFIPPIPIGEE